MEGPRKPRAGFSLRRLPLRQKIGALAAGIVLLMLSTGIVSILAYVTQISSPKSRHRSMHNTTDFKKVFIETNHIKNGRRTKFFA